MKRILSLIITILFLGIGHSFSIECNFEGISKTVINIEPEKNTGLDAIYVSYSSTEIERIVISGINGTQIDVKKYSSLGGGYAEEIPFVQDSGNIVIERPAGNLGYLITSSDRSYSFWLVDYSAYPFRLTGVSMSPEQECENTGLNFTGTGSEIKYFTIDGRQMTLSREIELSYQTLEWNEEQQTFDQINVVKSLAYLDGRVLLSPPFYCNTQVYVNGDRFLNTWGEGISIESGVMSPVAVLVNSTAEQTNRIESEEGSNVIKTEDEGLGGSAPAEISFRGYISDAVLHTEWQIASDPEFEYVQLRFNEQDLNYTFTEEGRYYVRFIGSNADGSCESIGETFAVMIGSSDLRIPNAFSPNNDGVNDVWKVGYRSLLEFECWIFDSKGKELFRFNDPSSGWDGTFHGKTVNPGVYYYVIRATGADGIKYKKSGDINILNYKKLGDSTGSAEIEE